MQIQTGLIVCPNCERLGKKQVLGRVLESGHFMVLRFHHGTTIIKSKTYTVTCGCGQEIEVDGGTVVVSQINPAGMVNGAVTNHTGASI